MNPSSNLFLIGPMGAGKSTVGKRLARELGLRFVDLDEEIERVAGASIPMLFDLEGEAAFRTRETAALEAAASRSGVLLATGGGCILAPRNQELLRANGFVLYLEASVELQLERLARDHSRPLLRTTDRAQKLQGLAQQRNQIYQALADVTLPADRAGPGPTARRGLAALRERWQPLPPARFPETVVESLPT